MGKSFRFLRPSFFPSSHKHSQDRHVHQRNKFLASTRLSITTINKRATIKIGPNLTPRLLSARKSFTQKRGIPAACSVRSRECPSQPETSETNLVRKDESHRSSVPPTVSQQSSESNALTLSRRIPLFSCAVGTLFLPTTPLKLSPPNALLRRGTAAAFLPSISALLSFGGCARLGGSRWLQSDLRSARCITSGGTRAKQTLEAWCRVPFASFLASPVRRHRHSLTTLSDNQVLLFGGRSGASHYNDVWLLDGPPLRWKCLLPSDSIHDLSDSRPAPRSNHRAVVWDIPVDVLERLREIRPVNLQENNVVETSASDYINQPVSPSSSSSPLLPSGLVHRHHQNSLQAVETENRKKCFVAFGGITQGNRRCQDCWIFDVDQIRWCELPLTGLPASSKDSLIGVWRNALYVCGLFGREAALQSPLDCASRCKQGKTNSEEDLSVYTFNVDSLRWSLCKTDNQILHWCPLHDVIVGCTWLQCMPSTVMHGTRDSLPEFYLFDFAWSSWTRLHLAASPLITTTILNDTPAYRFHRYSEPRSLQLLSFSDPNQTHAAVVVLHGLAHPVWLKHQEITRSFKWERRYCLLWLHWLARFDKWESATPEGQRWKKVFMEMPEDIVRTVLEFL